MDNKFYIGDGVYVQFDGSDVVLTTENGVSVTNTIVLEPDIYAGLIEIVRQIAAQRAGAITEPR